MAGGQDADKEPATVLFMKPVYIQHIRQDVLTLSPKLREFLNLNAWFFYPRKDNGYDTSKVCSQVFRENYLNSSYPANKDSNHPSQSQLQTVNIESYRLDKVDDPQWKRWINEVRVILHGMRSTGRQVVCYGLDGDRSLSNYWELYRRQFVIRRPDLAAEKMPIVDKRNRAIRRVNRKLRDLVDVNTVVGYCPKWVPSADSWEADAFIYQLERRVEFRKALEPKKPLAVWLQPNLSQNDPQAGKKQFDPLPIDVWNRFYNWAQMNNNVDSILVFTKGGTTQPEGWTGVFNQRND